MLTELEQTAMKLSGELADLIQVIITKSETESSVSNIQTWDYRTSCDDWREAADSIHKIQQLIAAQSAAREYPTFIRLLGHKFI